jgi:hypothetical protein
MSLLLGNTFNLVIGTVEAEATYPVTFTLTSMGATTGQVLKYNGSEWSPSSLPNSQIYLGTWSAATNVPDISTLSNFQAGDYYIVSTTGSFDNGSSTLSLIPGDWIMYNGTLWEKIDNTSNVVQSFNNRKGAVTLTPADYVSLVDTSTHKLTGSSLNNLADIVDLTTTIPSNGQVLKWNSGTNKWTPSDDIAGGGVSSVSSSTIVDGTILNADINDSAAIAQSKIANLSTDLGNKISTTLTSTHLLIGNGSSIATDTALSGDATLSNTGVLTLKTTGTAGTYTSVTTDTAGRITAGTNTAATTSTNGYLTSTDWNTFNNVLGHLLTGFATVSSAVIGAGDSILIAFEKLQAQIATKASTTDGSQTITASSIVAISVTGLNPPSVGADATNKTYVDAAVAGGSTPTCPTGYLLVPKNTAYTTKDFCVMKYLASNDGYGTATSTASALAVTEAGTISSSGTTVTGVGTLFTTIYGVGGTITASGQTQTISAIASATSLTTTAAFNPVISAGTSFTGPAAPWVNIPRTTNFPATFPATTTNGISARTACQALGQGYDLISNSQWQTVARNIAGVATNWITGTVASGEINRGHSDNVPPNALSPSSDDTSGNCSGNRPKLLQCNLGFTKKNPCSLEWKYDLGLCWKCLAMGK